MAASQMIEPCIRYGDLQELVNALAAHVSLSNFGSTGSKYLNIALQSRTDATPKIVQLLLRKGAQVLPKHLIAVIRSTDTAVLQQLLDSRMFVSGLRHEDLLSAAAKISDRSKQQQLLKMILNSMLIQSMPQQGMLLRGDSMASRLIHESFASRDLDFAELLIKHGAGCTSATSSLIWKAVQNFSQPTEIKRAAELALRCADDCPEKQQALVTSGTGPPNVADGLQRMASPDRQAGSRPSSRKHSLQE